MTRLKTAPGPPVQIGPRPTIYEINTPVWLTRLGIRYGGAPALTLDAVPAEEWDALASLPYEAVWLMGVWKRSAEGLKMALADPQIQAGNQAALGDLKPSDVIGSGYCVADYVVDDRFGGPDALATARGELARRGLGLILDYVPNHVAPDHPWLAARPGCFVHGSDEELADHPEAFLQTPEGVVARGKDPYFAPWPDVVQLNAFAPELRSAATETLVAIGEQCDGVRCDMAMLMVNEVFARTWGDRVGPQPPAEFWPIVIGRVRQAHPSMLFIAEAYWDMEWTLQQQGFDFCYDKTLYDRLVSGSAEAVRGHLQGDLGYQEHLIRFIENHDEPRAAATLAPGQARAAAVVMSTLPGARLYHDGQLDGLRVHIPVFLARGPEEQGDADLRGFYERLLGAVAESGLKDGRWQLADVRGWPDNDSFRRILAWGWAGSRGLRLVAVNLSCEAAQGMVSLDWPELDAGRWTLSDALSGRVFEREGSQLSRDGLYVALEPWQAHFLAFAPGPAPTPLTER